ncbi:MAG: IBR domain-containing protein [Cetobacterium sp.]
MNCTICFDTDFSEFIQCDSNHYYCIDCANNAIKNVIESKCFLRCADPACESIIDESRLDNINNDILENYKKLTTQLNLALMPDSKFCGKCDYIFLTENDVKNFFCEKCSETYCIECKEAVHEGTCLHKQEIFTEAENLTRTAFLVCSCGVTIERDEGCNHMQCNRCHSHWCWACKSPWHSGQDYYSCNGQIKNQVDINLSDLGNIIRARQQARAQHQESDEIKRNIIAGAEKRIASAINYRRITQHRDETIESIREILREESANGNKAVEKYIVKFEQIRSDIDKKRIELLTNSGFSKQKEQLKKDNVVRKRAALTSVETYCVQKIIIDSVDNLPNLVRDEYDKLAKLSDVFVCKISNEIAIAKSSINEFHNIYDNIVEKESNFIDIIDSWIIDNKISTSAIIRSQSYALEMFSTLKSEIETQIANEKKYERISVLNRILSTDKVLLQNNVHIMNEKLSVLKSLKSDAITRQNAYKADKNAYIATLESDVQNLESSKNNELDYLNLLKKVLTINECRKKLPILEKNSLGSKEIIHVKKQSKFEYQPFRFLHYCQTGDLKAIKTFIQNYDDATIDEGLYRAVSVNRPEIVEYILKYRQMNICPRKVRDSATYSIKKNYMDILKMLLPIIKELSNVRDIVSLYKYSMKFDNEFVHISLLDLAYTKVL